MVAKQIVLTVGAAMLAIFLFALPLFLKFHVYKETRLEVTTTDVIPVTSRISTLWCEQQELRMRSPFNAFLFSSAPELTGQSTRSATARMIRLPNRSVRQLGFFFLEGSSLSLSACSRLSGALLSLVKGKRNLNRCLAEHQARAMRQLNGLEESESDSTSNSNDQTSSISSSQGFASNESEEWFVCHLAERHAVLESNYRCTSSVGRSSLADRKSALSYTVASSDYYFLLFFSDTFLDILPNEVFVELELERNTLNFSESFANCTNTTECLFPLRMCSGETVVVEAQEADDDWITSRMTSVCHPRKGLYFVFYLAAGIVIFICAFQ